MKKGNTFCIINRHGVGCYSVNVGNCKVCCTEPVTGINFNGITGDLSTGQCIPRFKDLNEVKEAGWTHKKQESDSDTDYGWTCPECSGAV